ncbi:FeoA family protein [Lachnoclostridium sp. An118]|uniref:FeoA family protein n=1 Tax=Lachnoclostridium sp. An118 TaxID=1965547 RepID=UPI000B38488E|nr:FeoA family protein [Lachnoclostridium sp. An118]OUQ50447.1 ferrous iron transport protein A [Lachnoclostridium sp. An118]
MILKQGKNDHTYQVCGIHTEKKLERRLEALGLTEGALITILNNDKKGSLTARFRGTRFALGRQIADNIDVREVAEDGRLD